MTNSRPKRWPEISIARLFMRQSIAKKSEAIIYFDGPLTKWNRSRQNWTYEDHGGLRIPLDGMPAPDDREIVDRKQFRSPRAAQAWVLWRLKGFDTSKIVGEVRPL